MTLLLLYTFQIEIGKRPGGRIDSAQKDPQPIDDILWIFEANQDSEDYRKEE